jgi:hypothetical protein
VGRYFITRKLGAIMSISANTYYTASTIAEIKGLTTRPSVIQSLEGNGVYNWTAGSTLDGDDVTVIEPTSPTPAGRYILEVTDYPLTVEDLAALKALTSRPESVVVKTGQAAGVWQWVAGSSTTADDALVVECTSGTAGRYKRINDGVYQVDWWGAVGDGTTDDTVAIQAAVTASAGRELRFGPKNYRVAATLGDACIFLPATGITIRGSGRHQTIVSSVSQAATFAAEMPTISTSRIWALMASRPRIWTGRRASFSVVCCGCASLIAGYTGSVGAQSTSA